MESIQKGISRHMKSGTLQVMGFDGTLSWAAWEECSAEESNKEFLVVQRERLLIPARFLPGTRADEVAQTVDDAVTGIGWPELEAVLKQSPSLRVLVLGLTSDLAPCNTLAKHQWAEKALAHNRYVREHGGTFIIILDGRCYGHILNRITVKALKAEMLVNKMYNTCFTMRDVNKWVLIRRGFMQVVREDLSLMHFRGQRPPRQNNEHNQRILMATLYRHRYTRADDAELNANRETMMTQTGQALLELLNGDWRLPYLQHYCWSPRCPCQQDTQILVDAVGPLLERAVFDPLSSKFAPQSFDSCNCDSEFCETDIVPYIKTDWKHV